MRSKLSDNNNKSLGGKATLSFIAGLARIMKEQRIDAIHIGDIKIVKTHHDPIPQPLQPTAHQDQEDEVLFHSSS